MSHKPLLKPILNLIYPYEAMFSVAAATKTKHFDPVVTSIQHVSHAPIDARKTPGTSFLIEQTSKRSPRRSK